MVAGYVAAGIGASFALFAFIRMFARGPPSTMNKEYQEATNEYLKVCLDLLFSLTLLLCAVRWVGDMKEFA